MTQQAEFGKLGRRQRGSGEVAGTPGTGYRPKPMVIVIADPGGACPAGL